MTHGQDGQGGQGRAARRLELTAPAGFPPVRAGDDLATLVLETLGDNGLALADGDVVVVAQKVVSKAEGRMVRLDSVAPSAEARDLAVRCGKDPRVVELVLRESQQVMRCVPGVLIVRHRLGFVHANAGIDRSNIEAGDDQALLLPEDPDASAAALREGLRAGSGRAVGVLVIDSFGRAWRQGTCGVCIGSAGLRVINDCRGGRDLYGRVLEVTEVAEADELAAAASLVMGGAAEATPLVLARGLELGGTGHSRDLLRPVERDLFP